LGAGQQRALLDDVGNLPFRLRLPVDFASIEDFRGLRQMAGQRLVDRCLLVEQLELEERGLANERLGARRVLHARQLDQDLIRALPGDGGLAPPELIDAVADRLEALTDRVVAQLADPTIAHHETEATGRLILIAHVERIELRHDGPGVVPRLRVRQLDRDRGIPFTRDPLDGDPLALERALEVLGGAVGLARDVAIGLDAEHQMDTALEIQPEIDRALRRIQVPDRDGDDGDDEADAYPKVPRHPSRPALPSRGRWRSGRTRA